MLDLKEIEDILLNIQSYKLSDVCGKLRIKKSGTKQVLIDRILNFYSEENWVENMYNSLNEYEKDMIDTYTQQKFYPTDKSISEIKKKHSRKLVSLTKFNYFFINGIIPNTIKQKLTEIVPPLEIKFKNENKKINLEDSYAYISGRENNIKDFDELIKYISSHKIKPTTKERNFPKSALLNFHKQNKYIDAIKDDDSLFEDIKNIEDTTVSYGMIKLLQTADIIDSKSEYFKLGTKTKEFVKLNKYEKFKFLLENYLNSSTKHINEISRIERASFKINQNIDLTSSRKMILEMIKLLPLDYSWISGDKFKENIRMKDVFFLRKNIGRVLVRDEYYNSYYYAPSFDQLEEGFIDVSLIEFLATLGIIDVIIDTCYDEYGYRCDLIVKYLRLTELGAVLLGLKEIKGETLDDNKFIIDDNFNIIIPIGSKKLEYELFFERFLNKVEENSNNTVYQINFNGFVKAYDLGIDILSIIEYMEINSKNFSNIVNNKLKKWSKSINKINIKTVTIIEYPEEIEYLLFETKKIDNFIEQNNYKTKIIKDSKKKELKKYIEKKELFCKIEK